MVKRRRYDDQFRASAVVMLQAAGYPDQKGSLEGVAKYLKMPAPTLHRWFREKNNPPPSELVTEKKEELADVFERIAYKYLTHADRDVVIEETSGKDAVVTAATAVDKMRLLRDLPTEIVAVLPVIVQAVELMKAHGHEPSQVFERIIQRYATITND